MYMHQIFEYACDLSIHSKCYVRCSFWKDYLVASSGFPCQGDLTLPVKDVAYLFFPITEISYFS